MKPIIFSHFMFVIFGELLCLITAYVRSQRIPVEPHIRQILDIHNDYRRQEGSSNMQKLVWDDDLAVEAQDWTRRCVFEHKIVGHGENLAFMTNYRPIDEQIRTVMEDMYNEKNVYSYNDQNNCGASCHYTQIVWANTTRVGCGMYVCDSLVTFSGSRYQNAWYLVCMYEPRANFCLPPCYPFLVGPACSKCKQGQVCDNGLCRDQLSRLNDNNATTIPQQFSDRNGQDSNGDQSPNNADESASPTLEKLDQEPTVPVAPSLRIPLEQMDLPMVVLVMMCLGLISADT